VQMEADRDIILDWRVDMEPHLLALLEAKHARQGKGSYKPCEAQDVAERLGNLLDARGINARAQCPPDGWRGIQGTVSV
jgi:hypothetical protein